MVLEVGEQNRAVGREARNDVGDGGMVVVRELDRLKAAPASGDQSS